MAIALRFVDVPSATIYERFLTFVKAEKLDAEGLTEYILTTLREHQLDPNCIISHGYDGALVMAGNFSGVQAWIKHVIPSTIYIHCHAHVLNLCLVDSTKAVRYSGEFFALLESLYIFLSSSKCHTLFIEQQRKLHPGKTDSAPAKII